jgi:hypothetical protein
LAIRVFSDNVLAMKTVEPIGFPVRGAQIPRVPIIISEFTLGLNALFAK